MPECPRLEEFVDFGDGVNYYVNSVRWSVDDQSDPESCQAQVELNMGHPPRFH
jgi:hypothetical protein